MEWTLATRFQAHEDTLILAPSAGNLLDPSAPDGMTSQLGLDAPRPSNSCHFDRMRVPEPPSRDPGC